MGVFDRDEHFIKTLIDARGEFFVGLDGVTAINEHQAQGEGDRYFYDVQFEGGHITRLFQPQEVVFEPIPKGDLDTCDIPY